ncbi:MAG: RecX family transcriptional regulator [Alistipes putredinis]
MRDKIRLSGWGARKIRTSLRLKGIAAAIIDEGSCPTGSGEPVRTAADTDIEKKLRLTRYKDTYDLKTKLIRYGLSLGYDYDAVLDAAGELIQTNDEPCDDF